MKTKTKALAAVVAALWLTSGGAKGEEPERTLTYWDEEVRVGEVLYPAGVGETEAEAAGVRLDPAKYLTKDPRKVTVVWQIRYRAADPDGLDEVRKAWEASLPEGAELVIEVHAKPKPRRRKEERAETLNREDQTVQQTLARLGKGREAHLALVDHFSDPARKEGDRREWRPGKAAKRGWSKKKRTKLAAQLGVGRDEYRETEIDPVVSWERWMERRLTQEIDAVLETDPRWKEGDRGQTGRIPRIIVNGRWIGIPDLSGGLAGNLRGANAAIARELGGGPRHDGAPRSTEAMRRWIAASHGVVLNRGRDEFVWNEEKEELWVVAHGVKVLRVYKMAEDGRGWTGTRKDGREARAILWPLAGQLEAWPDKRRHPTMLVADQLQGSGVKVKTGEGVVTLGPGRRAAGSEGREGEWWVEGGRIHYRIGDRTGEVDWREAGDGVEVEDWIWRRRSPWEEWRKE